MSDEENFSFFLSSFLDEAIPANSSVPCIKNNHLQVN